MIEEVLKKLSGLGVPDELLEKIKSSIEESSSDKEECCPKCGQPMPKSTEVSIEVSKQKAEPTKLSDLMKKYS